MSRSESRVDKRTDDSIEDSLDSKFSLRWKNLAHNRMEKRCIDKCNAYLLYKFCSLLCAKIDVNAESLKYISTS